MVRAIRWCRPGTSQLGVTRARLNQLLRLRRHGEPETLTTAMIAKVDTPEGRALYKKRAATIEPVFAQIKHNRKIRSLGTTRIMRPRQRLTAREREVLRLVSTGNSNKEIAKIEGNNIYEPELVTAA